jgi:hypothetical protein
MSSLPEWWTGPYPEVSSVKTATDYLDGLGAALGRREEGGSWVLSTGEQELITAGSSDELDSFVLGFALAHLICERHGPIGQRSGPVAVPHPADADEAGPAPLDKDRDDDDDDKDQDEDKDEGEDEDTGEGDTPDQDEAEDDEPAASGEDGTAKRDGDEGDEHDDDQAD